MSGLEWQKAAIFITRGRGNCSACRFPAGWWTVSKGAMKLQYEDINFKWSWHSWWLSAKQEAKHKPATEINLREYIHSRDIALPVFNKASIFCTLTGRLLCCLPAGYLPFPLTNIPQQTNWICSHSCLCHRLQRPLQLEVKSEVSFGATILNGSWHDHQKQRRLFKIIAVDTSEIC